MPAAIWRLPERARRIIWQAAGYEPGREQLAIHLDPHRGRQVAGGERSGKSLLTAAELLCWACASAGPIWIVGPTYDLARPEFLHLVPMAQACDLLLPGSLSMPKSGACSFKTRLGGEVATRTGQDAEKLAGIAPEGIAMVEAAQQSYEVYLRLWGRVAEKRGPLLLSGTFEGSLGWYPELFGMWQADNADGGRSFSLPTWTNRAIFPGGRDDPEIKALEARFPADLFMERFGGTPCPPATLVFKEFRHLLHVKHCPFNEALPVQVWVDPGYAHAYAVEVAQIDHGNAYLIDEVWERGVVAQEIIARCKEREWWKNVRQAIMCIGGAQHQGMESHEEIWRRLAGIPVVIQDISIPDGILRHRTFLVDPETKRPRLFHDPKCKGAIWEYANYKYAEIKENRPIRELPIDVSNDAMKAIARGLVANFGFVAPPRLQRVSLRVSR
jgi:hypothetical protein